MTMIYQEGTLQDLWHYKEGEEPPLHSPPPPKNKKKKKKKKKSGNVCILNPITCYETSY
jgi:hypothetical protein